MAVKVEMRKDETKKVVSLAFETNDIEGQEVIDAVRVAIFGDHDKRGGYVNSNRLVVEIKTE